MNNEKIRYNTKSFYDNVSEKFSQTRSHFWPGFDFIRKYYKGKGKVLDFGCGNGRLVEFLESDVRGNVSDHVKMDHGTSLKNNYVGVDISEKMVETACQKYPDYNFQTIEDERKLSFEDGQFDFIFSIAVFHHFNPKMAKESLREFKRILKKDGVVIISVWHLWRWKYLKYILKYIPKYVSLLEIDLPFQDNEGNTHLRYCHFWTRRQLERLVQYQGFNVLESGWTRDQAGKKRNIYLVLRK